MKFAIQGLTYELFSYIKCNIDLLGNIHELIIFNSIPKKVIDKKEIIILVVTQDRIVTVVLKLIEFMAWH